MQDWVPGTLRVLRVTRPKYACRACNGFVQASVPERPIAGGLATPAPAGPGAGQQMLRPHPALYGVDLPRSAVAVWVGGAWWWLEARRERLAKVVLGSNHLFADDTPAPVLDPGLRRTKTGHVASGSPRRCWPTAEQAVGFQPQRHAQRAVARDTHA